jgi:hypothetical protein
MLEQLTRNPAGGRTIDPLPGWFARRTRDLPPAADVVARIPRGAVLPRDGRSYMRTA